MPDLAKRKDLGVRIGAEKGQLPDEVITRSQVIPGTNVYFEYLSNHDIRINARASEAIDGSEPTTIYGTIMFKYRPDKYQSTRHVAALDADYDDSNKLASETKTYYGSSIYVDIVHNWNLLYEDTYILQIHPGETNRSDGTFTTRGFETLIHSYPISRNTIRLFTTIPVLVNEPYGDGITTGWKKWAPGEDATDCKLRFPKNYSSEYQDSQVNDPFANGGEHAFSIADTIRLWTFVLTRTGPINIAHTSSSIN